MKEKQKSKSILFRLVITMLCTILLQFFLVIGAICISGVTQQLDDNAYEIFSQTVINRKNYIENEMHNRWSVIDNYIEKMESMYPDKNSPLTEDEALSYFNKSADDLIDMLRNSSTTGAFIILNNNTEGTANSCLFITDGDPSHNNLSNNSDLLMLKGPLELTETLQIPLHIAWNFGITLDDETKNIYENPYYAASRLGSHEHLGYWNIGSSLYIPNTKSITYSKPLVDENGYVFGVAGVEIAQEYLYKILPESELVHGSASGYTLIKENPDGSMEPAMTRGSRMEKSIPYGKPLEFQLKNEAFGGYSLSTDGKNLGACYQKLALYNKNTPYTDGNWYLLGTTSELDLTNNSKMLRTAITWGLFISLITGIVIAILTGLVTSRSTGVLIRGIRGFMPGQKLVLGTTGISEIDELAKAVEQLNEKALNYAAKTDKIIGMVNMDIGFYEFDVKRGLVKLSAVLGRMLDLVTDESECVSIETFTERIRQIRENKSEDSDAYQYSDAPMKWLKLETVHTDSAEFGIVMDTTKEELSRRAIIYERDHDVLTGIYNRLAFRKHFAELMDHNNFTYGAFVMGDLDNLKHINDMYGHDLGDLYITKTAKVIESFLGNKDAIFGRMSGDEFYMFFYGDNIDEIRSSIYAMHLALLSENIILTDGTVFKLKMSCGIAWYPKDSEIKEELIRYADFAMYQGKHSVKGGIREFDLAAYNESSYMFVGKEELYSILEEQLCDYVFQPIYDVCNNKLYGYEALMRPYGKNINTPDKLINLAQSQGLLYKVEHNTFYMVLELCKKYRSFIDDKMIFINSVPNQILSNIEYEELSHIYADLLNSIVMEITENETINDQILMNKKELVRQWGGKLALDDFGSGYANDLSLIQLHPDIIKIDRMIIEEVDTDKQKQSIIRNTISFAKENGIQVLAEGVETKEQLKILMELGIDLAQGYYLSRPIPMPDFDDTQIADIIREIKNTSEMTK